MTSKPEEEQDGPNAQKSNVCLNLEFDHRMRAPRVWTRETHRDPVVRVSIFVEGAVRDPPLSHFRFTRDMPF